MKRFLALALLTILTSACSGGGSVPGPEGDQSATDSTSTTGGSVTGDDNSPQDPPEGDPMPDPVSKVDLLSLGSQEFIDQVFSTQNLVEPTQEFLQGSWTVRIFRSVLQGDHYVEVEQPSKQVIFENGNMKSTLNVNPPVEVFDLAPLFRYFPFEFYADEVLAEEKSSVSEDSVIVIKHHIPDGTILFWDTTKFPGFSIEQMVNHPNTLADIEINLEITKENQSYLLAFKASGTAYKYCRQSAIVGQGETPEEVKVELEAICDQQEQQGLLNPQAESISLGKGEIGATLDYKQPMFWVINNGTPVMYFFIRN